MTEARKRKGGKDSGKDTQSSVANENGDKHLSKKAVKVVYISSILPE